MAYLGKNDPEKAEKELKALNDLTRDETLKEITIWEINSVDNLSQIAARVLKAEILATQDKFDESMVLLKEAIEIEDALNYNEPPDWFFSVRHHLGAVQIEAGKYEEAIKTYKEDLKELPKNGWAHHGLKLAYQNLNDPENVARVDELLKDSWAHADLEINTSRIK